MTPLAWIVRHEADTPDTRPAVYFSAAEAEAHAAQYLPGVAVVVPLGDVAAVRAHALEEAARTCEALPLPNGPLLSQRAALEQLKCAAAIRALPPLE